MRALAWSCLVVGVCLMLIPARFTALRNRDLCRRSRSHSSLWGANRSVGEWGKVFGDAVVATAIFDRLRQPGSPQSRGCQYSGVLSCSSA